MSTRDTFGRHSSIFNNILPIVSPAAAARSTTVHIELMFTVPPCVLFVLVFSIVYPHIPLNRGEHTHTQRITIVAHRESELTFVYDSHI